MIKDKLIGKYAIVRSKAGIFAGVVDKVEKENETYEILLKDSRRLRYWDGASTLSELSQKGVSRPNNCEFPAEIPWEFLPGCFEVLLCSKDAEKSIKDVKIWTQH